MAYKGALMVDDETLFRTMEVAADTGALVMVHAENGDAIDVLVKKALADGHTEPHWHALTRPPETEGEATNRAIQLARVAGVPLGRPEDDGLGRLLEDPERRAGAREPAAHDPRVRRACWPDLAQPHGRAAVHEPGQALRALSAQGHDRSRLRRRHRRLRPREDADDQRREPALEGGLQPLRGHGGDGLAGGR